MFTPDRCPTVVGVSQSNPHVEALPERVASVLARLRQVPLPSLEVLADGHALLREIKYGHPDDKHLYRQVDDGLHQALLDAGLIAEAQQLLCDLRGICERRIEAHENARFSRLKRQRPSLWQRGTRWLFHDDTPDGTPTQPSGKPQFERVPPRLSKRVHEVVNLLGWNRSSLAQQLNAELEVLTDGRCWSGFGEPNPLRPWIGPLGKVQLAEDQSDRRPRLVPTGPLPWMNEVGHGDGWDGTVQMTRDGPGRYAHLIGGYNPGPPLNR